MKFIDIVQALGVCKCLSCAKSNGIQCICKRVWLVISWAPDSLSVGLLIRYQLGVWLVISWASDSLSVGRLTRYQLVVWLVISWCQPGVCSNFINCSVLIALRNRFVHVFKIKLNLLRALWNMCIYGKQVPSVNKVECRARRQCISAVTIIYDISNVVVPDQGNMHYVRKCARSVYHD